MDSEPPSFEPKDRPLTFAAAAIWTVTALFLDLFLVGLTEAGREGASAPPFAPAFLLPRPVSSFPFWYWRQL